jgi:D-sedoheptulose 7-phosphate isomerase
MIHDKLVKAAEDQKELLNEIMITHAGAFEVFAREVVQVFNSDGRLLLAGSGTLGAVANLVANLFTHRLSIDRPMLPAVSLCQNPVLASALAVDNQSDQYFVRQFRTLARPGDILLVFDDPHHDLALREAMLAARDLNCKVGKICLCTDDDGGDPDYLFCFPQVPPARGIEAAVFFGSLLCELVEGELFGI